MKKYFLVLIVLILISLLGCQSSEKNVKINIANKTITTDASKEITILVRLNNRTEEKITSNDDYYLSYHLLDENKQIIKFDNPRTPIEELPYNKYVDINMKVDVPVSGTYYIEADIVQEKIRWFKDTGNPTDLGELLVSSAEKKK